MKLISLKTSIFLLGAILLVDSVVSTPVPCGRKGSSKKGHKCHRKKPLSINGQGFVPTINGYGDFVPTFSFGDFVPTIDGFGGEGPAPTNAALPAADVQSVTTSDVSLATITPSAETTSTSSTSTTAPPETASATPTPSPEPTPTPSPTPAPTPTPAPAPAPAPAAGGDHSGDGTFFSPGLGACGSTVDSSAAIVALASPDFDPQTPNGNPNQNPLCGKQIRIFRNGKTVDATVQDRCPECHSGDVDMSPAVFDQIASESEGRVAITWKFLN